MQLQVLQAVRISWLNLYYWIQAKQIILNEKKVFQHLLGVSESMLANNKAQQKDVIRAQLEVTEMDDRLLMVRQQIETAGAELGRWIGPELENQANPNQLPIQPAVPNTKELLSIIERHPVLKSDEAVIYAGRANVGLARQQYKPGFNVGLVYGYRQVHNPDGSKLPDLLTAQVGMDLPIFPKNRQDRTLKASIDNLAAAQEDQISHYRQLRQALMTQLASWEQQRNSAQLYQKRLIPEAKQYAEATMIAYQNTQTDFPTLARAYVRELNTELSGLRASVNQEIARVNLLYLQGK